MSTRLLRFATACLAVSLIATTTMADVFKDSGENGVLIPDNLGSGVNSVITITQNQVIQDASFSIEGLNHSWIGDLIISVSHSTSGKSATLMHRVGTNSSDPNSTGHSADMNGTYTFNDGNPSIWTASADGASGFVTPEGIYDASGVDEAMVNLNSLFAGETTEGVWTFNISDNNETQSGSFFRTSVSFVTAVPEPGTYAAVAMTTLLAGFYLRRRHLAKKLAASK